MGGKHQAACKEVPRKFEWLQEVAGISGRPEMPCGALVAHRRTGLSPIFNYFEDAAMFQTTFQKLPLSKSGERSSTTRLAFDDVGHNISSG